MRPQSRGCASACRVQLGIDAELNASDENNMSNWRAKYNAYMRSEDWQRMRNYMFALRGYRCEWCDAPATDVHHRTYERLGHELPIDLQVLCRQCHREADRERAIVGVKKLRKKYAYPWDEAQEKYEEARDRFLETVDDDAYAILSKESGLPCALYWP
jgi:5-methylcytosine-specific restriction endonuclease McrA